MAKMKVCSKCGIEKEETSDNFYYRKERKSFVAKCKCCSSLSYAARYAESTDEIREYNRKSYEKNKERIQSRRKELVNSNITSRLKKILQNSKNRADKKGWVFDLTLEDLETQYRVQDGLCAYSGVPLEVSHGDNMVSIDRIDSSKGYTYDNIQFSTYQINLMKRDVPHETFINLCKLVAREV